ncbi:MAG: glycosyltransferase [Bacteroidetes bacterium]|nr:glycosyltransferase [Bacteroidota bacterium]
MGFDLSRFSIDTLSKRVAFRQKFGIQDDEIAVGIIGRLVPIKNHGLFLRAISDVLKNTSQKVRAIIIGDGENKQEVIDLCFRFKLPYSTANFQEENHPIVFTSWILNVDEALAGLDIVALTSLNEGTPVSLIEAQAAGKPIVTTDVGGVRDVVIENKTALLSPISQPQKFADNLLSLVNDEAIRSNMCQIGQAHVNEKFHYTRLVQNMRTLYHQLLT